VTSPWVDNESLDAATMYARTTAVTTDHETRIADLEAVTLHVDDLLSPLSSSTAPVYSILVGSASGTSAAFSSTAAEVGHPGVLTGATGTTTTGRCSLRTDHQAILLDPASTLTVAEWVLKVPALSTAGEEFQVRAGFLDAESGAPTDGVYFEYDRTASVNWRIGARSGSSGTPSATSTAVDAGTWYTLRVELTGVTSAEYLINGISVGTVTTNIPSGTGHECGLSSHIIKSAGTTSRTIRWDKATVQF
jgi:SO2946-like, C-terminal domain